MDLWIEYITYELQFKIKARLVKSVKQRETTFFHYKKCQQYFTNKIHNKTYSQEKR